MALELVSAPAVAVVTTAEAKAHMRETLVDASNDAYIDALVLAAVSHLDGRDGILNRALVNQTWKLHLDRFPHGNAALRLPLPPLQSVTSITYVDGSGVTQTWAQGNYIVDAASEPSRIVPGYNQVYPSTRWQANAVTITFVAGYGPAGADVPAAIVMAVKHLAAHWYENREAVTVGVTAKETPLAVDRLIAPHRVRTEF